MKIKLTNIYGCQCLHGCLYLNKCQEFTITFNGRVVFLEDVIIDKVNTEIELGGMLEYTYKFDYVDNPNIELEKAILSWVSLPAELNTVKRICITNYLWGTRWEELEKILLLRAHPIELYFYAMRVIENQWIEAEPIIRKDELAWREYSKKMRIS